MRNRSRITTTIKSINDNGTSCTYEDGWSFNIPTEARGRVDVGTSIAYETVQLSRVVAWGIMDTDTLDVEWIFYKTDADLDAEDLEFQKRIDEKNEAFWTTNKDDLMARMQALPIPLQRRMQNFLDRGKHAFEIGGFGYELTISELVVMFMASGGEDTVEIKESEQGQSCSGNQWDYAKALAKMMVSDPTDIETMPSGLTPITGDPYYDNA